MIISFYKARRTRKTRKTRKTRRHTAYRTFHRLACVTIVMLGIAHARPQAAWNQARTGMLNEESNSANMPLATAPTLGIVTQIALPVFGLAPTNSESLRALMGNTSLNIASAATGMGLLIGLRAESALGGSPLLASLLASVLRSEELSKLLAIRAGVQLDLHVSEMSFALESSSGVGGGSASRSQATLDARWLALTPSLSYSPFSRFDVQAALRLALQVTPPSLTVRGEGSAAPVVGSQTLSVPVLQPVLQLGVGYMIPLSSPNLLEPEAFFRPELSFQIPLYASLADAPASRASTEILQSLPRLYFGSSLTFSTESRAERLRRLDTLFVRDTTIALVSHTLPRRVQLLSRDVQAPKRRFSSEPETLTNVIARWLEGNTDSTALGAARASAAASAAASPTISVRESYLLEVPKPAPLLSASVDAEFFVPADLPADASVNTSVNTSVNALASSSTNSPAAAPFKRVKSVKVRAERTLIRVHIAPPVLPTLPALGFLNDADSTNGTTAKAPQSRAMQPYTLADTLLTSPLPRLRFQPRIVSEMDVERWQLDITQRGQTIASFAQTLDNKNGETLDSIGAADWLPSSEPENIIRANERLKYKLIATIAASDDSPQSSQILDSGLINVEIDAAQLAPRSENRGENRNEIRSAKIERIIDIVVLDALDALDTLAASGSTPHCSQRDRDLLAALRPVLKPHSRLRLILPYTLLEAPRSNAGSLVSTIATALKLDATRIQIAENNSMDNSMDNSLSNSLSNDAPLQKQVVKRLRADEKNNRVRLVIETTL
jgi:hypothetical protein